MRICTLLCLVVFLSCTDDKKAIEEVTVEVERGAILRTVEIRNGEFDINDSTSEFNILLEEQDIENGDLLEKVQINLSFIDHSPENGNQSIPVFEFEVIQASDFTIGTNGLPIFEMRYTLEEVLLASGITLEDVRCKDQFRLDLSLTLTDGRVFSIVNSAGTVVNDSGFFLSPFSYLINIVEPISSNLFTGIYQMEQTQVGNRGFTYGVQSALVELKRGDSNNVRVINTLEELPSEIDLDVSFICDIVVARRYQKAILPRCNSSDPRNQILLGPDDPPGVIDVLDDSVFELYMLEGFEGFNTGCDHTDVAVKFRFTKQ